MVLEHTLRTKNFAITARSSVKMEIDDLREVLLRATKRGMLTAPLPSTTASQPVKPYTIGVFKSYSKKDKAGSRLTSE